MPKLNNPFQRLEHFNDEQGYSINFEIEYYININYFKGFLRRDFTINAIMFEKYKDEHVLRDPLNGCEHLFKVNTISACSSNLLKIRSIFTGNTFLNELRLVRQNSYNT